MSSNHRTVLVLCESRVDRPCVQDDTRLQLARVLDIEDAADAKKDAAGLDVHGHQ